MYKPMVRTLMLHFSVCYSTTPRQSMFLHPPSRLGGSKNVNDLGLSEGQVGKHYSKAHTALI